MTISEADLGRMVLVADEVLGDADPAVLDLLRQAVPVALRDQTEAAADGARRALLAEAAALGVEGEHIPHRDMPEWVRLPLLDTWFRWCTGRGRTCLHEPHPDRPEPVFAAAWRPGLVACAACPHLIQLRRGSAADRTCDRCGRVTAGPEHGDGIHPARVQLGPLLFAYGSCGDCSPTNERN